MRHWPRPPIFHRGQVLAAHERVHLGLAEAELLGDLLHRDEPRGHGRQRSDATGRVRWLVHGATHGSRDGSRVRVVASEQWTTSWRAIPREFEGKVDESCASWLVLIGDGGYPSTIRTHIERNDAPGTKVGPGRQWPLVPVVHERRRRRSLNISVRSRTIWTRPAI